MQPRLPQISVHCGDVCTAPLDLLILKHAQRFFGADQIVAERLGLDEETLDLPPGQVALFDSHGHVSAKRVAFLGTGWLAEFRYQAIREFGFRAARFAVENERLADGMVGMTMHGVSYGLDEQEAFSAQIAGIFAFVEEADASAELPQFIIVEKDPQRANRLEKYLRILAAEVKEKYRPVAEEKPVEVQVAAPESKAIPAAPQLLDAGETSETKKHVFVAIPYTTEMEDVYEFGIRQPVNEAGLLCERCDHDIFTGDILERIKLRISDASLVIAEMSGGNPNVYLEVGFAWGRNVPTLLAARNGEELKFDVKGQKCLYYKNISDLRQQILEATRALVGNG